MPKTPREIAPERLNHVTGGAEPEPFWLPRAPMSPVPSGFGAWSDAMRKRGLL
ncbi:MAG TPA: hypothetical protein VGL61_12710 [Kofleriaceae bacterium]|jgi:hypothetical protein